jgi:STE24 endopeptidase
VTQGWRGWAYDLSRMIAIGAMLSGAGAALLLSLMKRFPRRWWLGAAVGATASEVLAVWLAPVVLAPLFNRYRELAPGGVRSDLLELARRAGVEVGQVLVVDASRRTTATNAYVTGLGQTKRVVLYDTLLEQFDPSEVRLVVAHELAHVKSRDVQRALLWAALVGPAGMLVTALLTERLAAHGGTRPGAPGSLPAFALAAALVGFAGSAASNQLSRRVEERADEFALDLAGEPRRFIEMERRLAVSNVADPDPPRALQWLFATHPPVIDRIGAAVAHERQRPTG